MDDFPSWCRVIDTIGSSAAFAIWYLLQWETAGPIRFPSKSSRASPNFGDVITLKPVSLPLPRGSVEQIWKPYRRYSVFMLSRRTCRSVENSPSSDPANLSDLTRQAGFTGYGSCIANSSWAYPSWHRDGEVAMIVAIIYLAKRADQSRRVTWFM